MIPGWLIAVLAIFGIYLVYITITQPEAGFRIFYVIFTVLGRIAYALGMVIYRIAVGLYNLFSRIFRRR